jgi:hypothetical protein
MPKVPGSAALAALCRVAPGHLIIVGGPTVEGWGYCYLVNAKNRLGGYTGYQPIYVVFSGTHVAGWAQNAELSTWNCF